MKELLNKLSNIILANLANKLELQADIRKFAPKSYKSYTTHLRISKVGNMSFYSYFALQVNNLAKKNNLSDSNKDMLFQVAHDKLYKVFLGYKREELVKNKLEKKGYQVSWSNKEQDITYQVDLIAISPEGVNIAIQVKGNIIRLLKQDNAQDKEKAKKFVINWIRTDKSISDTRELQLWYSNEGIAIRKFTYNK